MAPTKTKRAKPKSAEVPFETSNELRMLFNRHYEEWRKKHFEGLDGLARRCGVTTSYLSHVGRYGRVPGKPVLILLALNFELHNPQEFFDAANVHETWPFERGVGVNKREEETGFLSVKLDMNGLTEAIRGIVEKGSKARGISELTRGRPLRIGLNHYQSFLFEKDLFGANKGKGFFLELCDMLAMTLRCRIETIPIPHTEYPEHLEAGDIDIYGPKNVKPSVNLDSVSVPFCRMGISALVRKKPSMSLQPLPSPTSLEDLQRNKYQIAVPRNGRSHLFANVALGRPDSELIVCETLDEAIERTTMTGITRPAHLVIMNSPQAVIRHHAHSKELELKFATADTVLELSDDCFAVRSDWPEMVTMLNQSIQYLSQTGTLGERFNRWLPKELKGLIQLPRSFE